MRSVSLRQLFPCVILACALLVHSAAVAQEGDPVQALGSSDNVLMKVRIVKLEDGKPIPKKFYELVLADGGRPSNLLSGARVPIPISSHTDGDDSTATGGETTYIYQNVGFSIEARAWILGDGVIRLEAQIEDSRIVEPDDENDPPVVETLQIAISANLADGTTRKVVHVEGEDARNGYVEVEASILK